MIVHAPEDASEDASAFFGGPPSDGLQAYGDEFLPNERFADGPHWTRETADELEAAGRITGYAAWYSSSDMPAARRSSGMYIRLDLYQDDESASAALGRMGHEYPTEPFYFDGPGDETIALPSRPETVRPDGGKGTCPCELGFRAGPIVGFVRVSQPLPKSYGLDGFDGDEIAVAQRIAHRISAEFS
jgi:hypothetical protein